MCHSQKTVFVTYKKSWPSCTHKEIFLLIRNINILLLTTDPSSPQSVPWPIIFDADFQTINISYIFIGLPSSFNKIETLIYVLLGSFRLKIHRGEAHKR